MHVQPLFAMTGREELHRLMRDYPLATVVVARSGKIDANLLPLHLADRGAHGLLSGHVARSHSLWAEDPKETEVTAVFQSPNAYISPRWYVNGQRSGRNAPSWNYVVVQAQGRLRFIDDADWMRAHLAALTAAQEAGRPQPWSVDDASPEFLNETARRLVGFEIEIQALTGKRFLSQQRTQADRESLVRNLEGEVSLGARAVGGLIGRRGA
ncbi:negative transcriptional regulator, PaiB family [Variovorax sp. PDC80]|uniref:FMN-binding negative transcriptional regulator n=1 Tax=Variovorax sp. PDC80 TaxID=1882827 RepID=UPI0008EA5327|nr:FMN-binding negative transcriptional regulator [Variovorax sp. PDC80]SFO70675.1 negative transcriptional regulator, PaiB family [Variovorax sp. PDC80]